jgi:hypothetical protein
MLFFLALACTTDRGPEDWTAWFDSGADYSVEEPVEFTAEPYGLDGGIGALSAAVLPVEAYTILYGSDENLPGGGDCPFETTDALAGDGGLVRGVVTIHPRFYFKTSGCTSSSDEKYYGSYFIEDDTGGFFVLGDSKVAHLAQGNMVEMRVRAVRTNFGLDMVYAHDIVSLDREVHPIHYDVPDGPLGADHIARVMQVEGTVTTDKDTFGEIRFESDAGVEYVLALDVELNRRGVELPIGTRIRAAGPVLFSYDVYSIVIMRIGQVEILDQD